jgi:hypothetical protein
MPLTRRAAVWVAASSGCVLVHKGRVKLGEFAGRIVERDGQLPSLVKRK